MFERSKISLVKERSRRVGDARTTGLMICSDLAGTKKMVRQFRRARAAPNGLGDKRGYTRSLLRVLQDMFREEMTSIDSP